MEDFTVQCGVTEELCWRMVFFMKICLIYSRTTAHKCHMLLTQRIIF